MKTKQIRLKLDGRWAQLTPLEALEAAVALYRSGQRELARGVYRTVLRYAPFGSRELQALGGACYGFGDYAEALEHYRKAAARDPRNADVRSNLGVTFSQLGRFQEALSSFEEALAINPHRARTHSNYADLLTDLQRYEEAEAHCRRALEIDPRCAEALNNLGRALEHMGRPEQAVEAYRGARQADPNLALASFNLGAMAYGADRTAEAARLFEDAAAGAGEFAEAHYNHAHMLLRQGDFARGFEEYEWRWQCKAFPSPRRDFSQPLWDGSDLGGKTILLHAEQGLGDSIQFVRYAEKVAARNGRVLLEVQPELVRLLGGLPGVERVVAQGQDLPPFDAHCPLLSLPRAMGTRLDTIPAAAPYLTPDPRLVSAWSRIRTPGRLHVGLVWAGAAAHKNDRRRSIALARFESMLRLDGVAWFALTKGPAAAELLALAPGIELHDLSPQLNDFADTAAALANLDLIVSVDTAAAHLAGALGRPIWNLIPHTPDWRWLMDREDSPWYPTMRLFRQFQPDDWDGVMERVRISLAALLAESAQGAEVDKRLGVIGRGENNLTRWSDPGRLEGQWVARARAAAHFIPAGSRVLDLGCGAMSLERALPPGCQYLPCDLVRRDERTTLCDFNKLELPSKGDATLVTLLGVLEYVHEWKAFLRRLRECGLPVVLSYCPADLAGGLDRPALGWVNHASREELAAAFREAGFSVRASMPLDAYQWLYRLCPAPPLVRACRKVLVLSHAGAGNFGDRLGFHLLNSILPPQAEATWMPLHPAHLPKGDFDMGIIGIGNSLFRPNLTEDLLSVVERLPVSVGIFGTQYRESIDTARLHRLIDRLSLWLARYEEDVLLYGNGRKNVAHMGDWLINQFPMTRWTVDGLLTVDKWVLEDLPLDRTIQKIQHYREVLSERVHPLLCALSSAERVAYREQREDGTIDGRSGKFRSMLLDVFGRTFPEETFFEVDRDAVASYRARIQIFLAELPGLLASLLRLPVPAAPLSIGGGCETRRQPAC
jgi:tetratricopeptide (TPR) repeat protein